MTEQEKQISESVYLAIQAIHKRGNSVEIQRTKDGFKVLEVQKRLVKAVVIDNK